MPKKQKKNKKSKDFLRLEKLLKDKSNVCGVCGGETKLETVNLEEFDAGKLYLMENMPALVCRNCGEIWVPQPVIDEFEKMIAVAKARRKERRSSGKKRKR